MSSLFSSSQIENACQGKTRSSKPKGLNVPDIVAYLLEMKIDVPAKKTRKNLQRAMCTPRSDPDKKKKKKKKKKTKVSSSTSIDNACLGLTLGQDGLNVPGIKKYLTDNGIPFDPSSKRAVLQAAMCEHHHGGASSSSSSSSTGSDSDDNNDDDDDDDTDSKEGEPDSKDDDSDGKDSSSVTGPKERGYMTSAIEMRKVRGKTLRFMLWDEDNSQYFLMSPRIESMFAKWMRTGKTGRKFYIDKKKDELYYIKDMMTMQFLQVVFVGY